MTDETYFDPESFLPYLLFQAAETSGLAFQTLYKERYGLLRVDWRVLFHLGLYGAMTSGQIVRRTKTHKTSISRAVDRLAARGFVTRTRHPEDRRAEQIRLTDEGCGAFRQLTEVARHYETDLQARLNEQEKRHLHSALRKLADG